MSKQQEAKVAQGYVPKAIPAVCINCVNFLCDHIMTHPPTVYHKEGWFEDKNLRCAIGKFVVKKMGTCELHQFLMEEGVPTK